MRRSVSANDNLFDYFKAAIRQARIETRAELSDDVLVYLASLLADNARADRTMLPEQTLAELHARAAAAPPAQQANTYRELGDRALYQVGYFEESLSRKLVGKRYYEEMGAAAYHKAAVVFQRWFAEAFGILFRELAYSFHSCVTVLGEVRGHHDKDEHQALMDLYDRWVATGSRDCEVALIERGILLPNRLVIEG